MSGASNYEQGRMARSTDHGSANKVVDATAFAPIDRTDLTSRKAFLQGEIIGLKEKIDRARRMAYGEQKYLPPKTFDKMLRQLADYKKEISGIDVKLSQMRVSRAQMSRDLQTGERRSFENIFVDLAKVMLAGPVYDRVRVATLHEFSKQFGASDG